MIARPLDQGQGETCTIHALANATCHALADRNIEVIPEECLGAFKQLDKVDVFEGNYVEDFHRAKLRNMTNNMDGQYGAILLNIKRVRRITRGLQHVLVYDQTVGDSSTKHCVFLLKYQKVTDEFICLNSYGEDEKTVYIKAGQAGNVLYGVQASWRPVDKTDSYPRKLTASCEMDQIIHNIKILTFGIFGRVVNLCLVCDERQLRTLRNSPLKSFRI